MSLLVVVYVGEMVGDPGIEPGVGLPGGVTVRCLTLKHVAHCCGVDTEAGEARQESKTSEKGALRPLFACGEFTPAEYFQAR